MLKPLTKNWNGAKLHKYFKNESQAAREQGSSVVKGKHSFIFRWFNHLDPSIIKDKDLSEDEIKKLFRLQS